MQTPDEIDKLTDTEIRAEIARRSPNIDPGVDFWYRELARRDGARASARAERLTFVAVALAAVAVAVGVIQIVIALATS